jgi:hypothetical protein
MRRTSNLFNRNKQNEKFVPQIPIKGKAKLAPKPRKHESLIVFLIALAVNLGAAYLFSFVWRIGEVDALSTTANGFLTLYTGQPDIAAVTMVKAPLSPILQLIFIPLLKQARLTFFAGPMLSSVAGAVSLVFLNLIFVQLNIPLRFRWILILLTGIYPNFLYVAATGTIEALFILILIFVLWGALQITHNNMSFLICGFGLAVGYFAKYQTVALTIGMTVALIIYEWKSNYEWRSELEGRLISFITPILYAMGLWLVFNIFTLNEPFYFLNHLFTSTFSPAAARNASVLHPFFLGWGNIFDSVRLSFESLWQAFPLFLIASALGFIFVFRGKNRDIVSVLIILFSTPILMIMLVFTGVLPSWHYLWAYTVPMGMVLAALLYASVEVTLRGVIMAMTVLLTIASMGITIISFSDYAASPGEQRLYALLTGDRSGEEGLRTSDPYWITRHDAPIIAQALDQYTLGGKVLLDATSGVPLTVAFNHPEQLIVIDEINFQTLFEYPATTANFVLILEENTPINDDYGTREFPALTQANVDYASPVWSSNQTFLNWHLYALNIK